MYYRKEKKGRKEKRRNLLLASHRYELSTMKATSRPAAKICGEKEKASEVGHKNQRYAKIFFEASNL